MTFEYWWEQTYMPKLSKYSYSQVMNFKLFAQSAWDAATEQFEKPEPKAGE
jgi:hypothetical protein